MRDDRDDFLFHLYRGSDMLLQDRVLEAKEELERALSLSPQDAKSQDLLAGVYFRLGVYPRAIEIWERLSSAYPRDAALRVNLALALFKTGQADDALAHLHQALRIQPDHERAWGYLGLVYWRKGHLEQARDAFLRGGQASMARRMEEAIQQASRDSEGPSTQPLPMTPESSRFEGGAGQGDGKPDEGEGASTPRESTVGKHPDLSAFLERHTVPTPSEGVFAFTPEGDLLVQAPAGAYVRGGGLVAIRSSGPGTPVPRRARGSELDVPLGGSAPIHHFPGTVTALANRPWGRTFHAMRLRSETLYVRESVLFAFDPGLAYECAQLRVGEAELELVQVSGQGTVVLLTEATPHVVPIGTESELRVDPARLVGWAGRLFPSADASALGGLALVLRGEGAVVLG